MFSREDEESPMITPTEKEGRNERDAVTLSFLVLSLPMRAVILFNKNSTHATAVLLHTIILTVKRFTNQ